MKRLKLTIILSIILAVVVPFTSFAVGATIGADLSITGSYVIDPRTHDKYKDKFTAPTNFEYKTCGDVVVKYKVETNDGEKIGYNFYRIWTEQEYVGLYLGATDDCRIGYNVVEILREGHKNQQSCLATDCYDGTFSVARNINATSSSSSNFYALVGVNMNLAYYYDFEIVESDFPIFNNKDDATHYMNTGVVQNAIYDTTTHYSGDDLYFKDFQVVPHISSDFDKSYFDIYYELSDYALTNIDNLSLVICNDYIIDMKDYFLTFGQAYSRTYQGKTLYYSMKIVRYETKLYLNQIPCMKQAVEASVDKDAIFGNNGLLSFSDTDYSKLFLEFYLRCNTPDGFKQSKRNDYTYEFLTRSSDYSIWMPTTDVSPNGNFDYTQQGDTVTSNSYYYHDASENKYYYVDNGTKTEITENEYNNNSYVSGGGGGSSSSSGGAVANATIGDIVINVGGQGDYVDISPKDYKLFIDNIKTMLDELDTKGGLFLMLKDVYALFPAPIWVIVGGGLSSVIVVSIIKILRG